MLAPLTGVLAVEGAADDAAVACAAEEIVIEIEVLVQKAMRARPEELLRTLIRVSSIPMYCKIKWQT
jgi:hypothetical protein